MENATRNIEEMMNELCNAHATLKDTLNTREIWPVKERDKESQRA